MLRAVANPAASGSGTVTNTGTLTANQLIIGDGTVDVKALGSAGTTTTVLHGNAAGAPTFSAVSLTADVSGTLPVANGGTGLATLTANNVILGNGTSTPSFVAPGSSGNVLTSNGTTWQSSAPAGGSPGLVLLGTNVVTAASVAAVDFTSLMSSTYDEYEVHFENVRSTSNNVSLKMRVSTNNGSSFVSSAYSWGGIYTSSAAPTSASAAGNASDSSFGLMIGGGNVASAATGCNGRMIVSNANSSTNFKAVRYWNTYYTGPGDTYQESGGGTQNSAAVINALRFLFSSGDIEIGSAFYLYGVRKT